MGSPSTEKQVKYGPVRTDWTVTALSPQEEGCNEPFRVLTGPSFLIPLNSGFSLFWRQSHYITQSSFQF